MLKLGFEHTVIYRPGVLITTEGREEVRALEWVLQKILSLIDWGSYFSIPTKHLAKTMVTLALTSDQAHEHKISPESDKRVVRVLENKAICDYVS